MSDFGPGNLTMLKVWEVSCGRRCGYTYEDTYAIKGRVESDLRAFGWSKTVTDGWVCPECLGKIKRYNFNEEIWQTVYHDGKGNIIRTEPGRPEDRK